MSLCACASTSRELTGIYQPRDWLRKRFCIANITSEMFWNHFCFGFCPIDVSSSSIYTYCSFMFKSNVLTASMSKGIQMGKSEDKTINLTVVLLYNGDEDFHTKSLKMRDFLSNATIPLLL